MDNLEKLIKVGEIAFGKNWQSPLARYLSVSDRTIRNFISGSSRTPADLSGRLLAALEAKQAEISAAMELINSDCQGGDSITIEMIEAIADRFDYRDEQDKKSAIDEMNNAVYEVTHLSDIKQIAKNWSTSP
ncbi:hypothetical protein SERVES_01656 [Serratia ficaria]|uniref:hypothetical protein n=1 Tax=Serratia ficaria TaxID=61651 RepID=UPI00119ABB64|nr:hypothetical protein [Serratia ficaria]VVA47935.1 hypothetical protein SERVES_01656 [Serratia ficaria]